MTGRRNFVLATLGASLVPGIARAGTDDGGPLNAAVARRAGRWNVTETIWAAPGAPAAVTRGLVAERRAIGPFLQESLREGAGGAILRMDMLTYDRVEGRWDYVSMDIRADVGIMPAWSFGPDDPARITLAFAPFALPGDGARPAGRMLRMTETIVVEGPDADRKDQVFALADGSGRSWLAHQYRYTRL